MSYKISIISAAFTALVVAFLWLKLVPAMDETITDDLNARDGVQGTVNTEIPPVPPEHMLAMEWSEEALRMQHRQFHQEFYANYCAREDVFCEGEVGPGMEKHEHEDPPSE